MKKAKSLTLKELESALETLRGAPEELKKKLFESEILSLEKEREQNWKIRDLPQHKQSRLKPPEEMAFGASFAVSHLFRQLTGYNPQWAFDYYAETHHQAGRRNEYSKDDYEFFVWFVHQLIHFGNGKVRKESAYRLVTYLCDEKRKPQSSNTNSGLHRAIASSYREMEKEKTLVANELLDSGHWFFFMFRKCNFSEKPSKFMKREITDAAAIEAFRNMLDSLISQLKQLTPVIRKKDNYWQNGLFGWVPKALELTYQDPLDFLFNNYPMGAAEKAQRGRELMEFINAAHFWRDAPPNFKQVKTCEESLFTWDEIFRTATR